MDGLVIFQDVFPRKEAFSRSVKWGIIIGHPASGKTTFAIYLYRYYHRLLGYERVYRAVLDKEGLEGFLDGGCNNETYVYAIVDDVSFSLYGGARSTRDFLNKFFRVRHLCRSTKRAFFFFIVHYVKSIAPYFRAAHLKVLTSIDTVEIPHLKELFPEYELWDYYEDYIENYEDKYIYLVKTPRRILKLDATLEPEEIEQAIEYFQHA